jgi:hypothetical protein
MGAPAHDPDLDFIRTCRLCLKNDELIVQFIYFLAFMPYLKITIYNSVYSRNNKYIAFGYLFWYQNKDIPFLIVPTQKTKLRALTHVRHTP